MNFKKFAIASISLNLLIVLSFFAKRYYYAHSDPMTGMPDAVGQWNTVRVSVLELLPIDSTDIVFVGNSITEGSR